MIKFHSIFLFQVLVDNRGKCHINSMSDEGCQNLAINLPWSGYYEYAGHKTPPPYCIPYRSGDRAVYNHMIFRIEQGFYQIDA